MSEQYNDRATRRAAERLTQTVWLTLIARAAAIVMPFILAGIGGIALEWRADFRTAQERARETDLETAKILERVTTRQEALTQNDDRQDKQIDNLWRTFRGGRPE